MSSLEQKALEYHKAGTPGKVAIAVTKSVASQDDLAPRGWAMPAHQEPALARAQNRVDPSCVGHRGSYHARWQW